tara:strand:+ start:480 stop:614 length:135 start_codon:yes stop_codon:yes gene_type:complete
VNVHVLAEVVQGRRRRRRTDDESGLIMQNASNYASKLWKANSEK